MINFNISNFEAGFLGELFPLFRQIAPSIQAEIRNQSILKNYSPKSTVFIKGEPLSYLYLIIEGTIHIVKDDPEGKEQIVSILRKGDFFPHIGLFETRLTPGTAYTTQDTSLLLVPIQVFRNYCLKQPEILMEYSKVLSSKIIELQNRLEEKAFCSTYAQIIRRLLFLADRYGEQVDQYQTQLTISLTHEELAHLVGTTRETVSRSVTRLRKSNSLQVEKGVWLLNIPKLKELVAGCTAIG